MAVRLILVQRTHYKIVLIKVSCKFLLKLCYNYRVAQRFVETFRKNSYFETVSNILWCLKYYKQQKIVYDDKFF